MSSTYNAITNLQEIEMDSLIVNVATIDTALVDNLDCNVGVIDTLSSTTATLTSANIPTLTNTTQTSTTSNITTANITTENTTTANITTANITTSNTTNLNTNNIQANPNSSAITIYTSHTGTFSLGNTSNTNGIRMNNKLQMDTGKQIEITPTGFLACETIRGYSFGNPVSLYLTQTGAISFGNNLGTGGGITINDNTTIATGKKITTPAILVSGLTASKMVLTDASKNLISSSYTDTDFVLKSGSTMSGTLNVNDIQGTTTSSSITLYTNSSVSSPTITLGNVSGGTFSINPNTTMNGNLTLASGKTITLNTTGGKVLCNVFTGTTTTSNLTIGETGNTGTLTIYKTTNIPSLTANKIVLTDGSNNLISSSYTDTDFARLTANNTFSGATNTFSGILNCNTIRGIATTDNISLYGATTGTITLGTTTGGSFNINYNTTLASNKYLEITGDGYLVLPTAVGNTNAFIRCEKYNTWAVINPVSLFITTTGLITLGNISGTLQIDSTTTFGNSMTMAVNKNITLSGTGRITTPNISANDIQGTTTSSNINLFTNTSGATSTITLSNASNLGVFCQSDLFITTTKALGCNNIYSYSSGDLNLNTFNSLNFINLLNNTKVSSGKYITCEKYDSINATTALAIGSTNTTALIRIGGALTTGTLQLGTIGTMTGLIQCNSDVSIGTTATNKGIACNYFTALQATDLVRFLQNTTTGNLRICENHTSGTITIGHLTPSSDTGNCQMNKNLIMGTTGGLNPKNISCNYYYGLSVSSDVVIGGSTTSGAITFGDSSQVTPFTGGTYNYSFFGVGRYLGALNRRWAYTNIGYGNATTPTLFKNQYLTGKYLTNTMWASAPTEEWCSFDSDAEGEGSAFIQNGNTSCVINPGDQSVLWWLDEDTINGSTAGSTTYAWSGWKISTAGVFTLSSDRRIKRDITPIIEPTILDKLSLLQIVNFKWKAPTEEKYYKNGVLRRKYQEVHTGYIAQDVKQVFPDVVERENGDAYWTLKKDDLQQKYNMGIQALIIQNKEQQVQIDAQKIIIDDLTSRLARLEQLILNP